MQTLRKKTSPLKFKNETTRFLGDGVSFKAKLIGILEVSEARGDRMCQEALCDLKMAIRAAGEHKQRITINIAIDGLRLRDEKTGDCLYHHPVHKISFIAQDMTDSRAFGYIFGSPDTGHRFFGIKTDKAASQVVIAMRDLFQVVFALKKKEIELAKQHLEKSYLPSSPLFTDTPNSKVRRKKTWPSEKSKSEPKASSSESKDSGTAVADLVDLELALNSLRQGLHQMERITPSEPFGSKDDPFGDSFISYPVNKLILPPPPSSGRDRSNRTSEGSTKTPPNTATSIDSASESLFSTKTHKEFSFSSREMSSSHEETGSGDWFIPTFGNSLFEESVISAQPEPTRDEKHEAAKQEIMSQFDVFTELDPLGTGRSKPYIDKKHFFQELKNPPKKPLKELVSSGVPPSQDLFNKTSTNIYSNTSGIFSADPFGEDPFVKEDPFADSDFSKQDPFETEFATQKILTGPSPRSISESENAPEPPPRPVATLSEIQPPPLPPKKQSDIVLKPPPRPPHSEEGKYDYIETAGEFKGAQESSPPLPIPQRKTKFESDFSLPPERPRKSNSQHSGDEGYLTPINLSAERAISPSPGILLPPPQRHVKKEVTVASFLESKPSVTTSIATEGLTNSLEGLDMTLSQLTLSGLNDLASKLKIPAHKLSNMTLVQLTNYLSTFIKAQSNKVAGEEHTGSTPSFHADFAANFGQSSYDKYAVFRELQEEIKQTKIDGEPEELREEELRTEAQAPVTEDKYAALREIVEVEIKQAQDNLADLVNEDRKLSVEDINAVNKDRLEPVKEDVIEFKSKTVTPEKSPTRSPIMKSPLPTAVTEIMQASARLTSGSLSDVLSGSSPEVDNTGSNSDTAKKHLDPTGESWAIFDQPSVPSEPKEGGGAAQSEEGVSPWSSDSKEFGNRSPTEWKNQSKGSDRRKKGRDQEGWWDKSVEPEGSYYPANRRSTDSYEEEYYECYDRPRRRKQGGWPQPTPGGHSSSSRDVSPWEEEQPRRRDGRPWGRNPRGHSFDRHRVDSWDDDEEDDYEYDEERRGRGHYFQRHGSKDSDRHSSAGSRDLEGDRWEDYGAERRYRRRREGKEAKDRWCCPDWEQGEHDKSARYPQRRSERRDRYRSSRDSQDSPWEDEYSNEPEEPHAHYLQSKKNWKQRPSSASEMDRKTGEIKSRHYLGAGGSDGERDRRYKSSRRSRSRDSTQFPETTTHRHRSKSHKATEGDYVEMSSKKTAAKRLLKETAKPEQVNTFPRKGARTKSLFDNDFVPSDESPIIREKFTFETNDFAKTRQQRSFKERRSEESKLSPRYQAKPRSPFEDDFSPSEKGEAPPEGGISSIKEEPDLVEENEDSFSVTGSVLLVSSMEAVRLHLKTQTHPIFVYRMSLDAKLNQLKVLLGWLDNPGAAHTDELGYLFNSTITPAIIAGSLEDRSMRRFVELWTNFARYGNPTPIGTNLNVTWEAVSSEDNIRVLDIGSELQMKDIPEKSRLEVWWGLLKKWPLIKFE
ncbi:protein disabled isoform X3 [Euwallacea similis]|uniref:protein disabled isoform X3 n=1 Tax=Euwallacea similis TaxID=1736056 RepID=UPI00344D766D